MNDDETLGRAVEALLLASEHPLSATELHTLFEGASADGLWSTPTTVQQIDAVLRRLSTTLTPFGGLECVQVGGGYADRPHLGVLPQPVLHVSRLDGARQSRQSRRAFGPCPWSYPHFRSPPAGRLLHGAWSAGPGGCPNNLIK